ncbi:MAG: hypothetical protein RL358_876 [Pseudomonadota bacterium]|jgi:uncharacterized lipoprotein
MNIAKNVALLAALLGLAGCSELKPFDGHGAANAVPALTIPADLTPIKTLDTYQVPAAVSAVSVAL